MRSGRKKTVHLPFGRTVRVAPDVDTIMIPSSDQNRPLFWDAFDKLDRGGFKIDVYQISEDPGEDGTFLAFYLRTDQR